MEMCGSGLLIAGIRTIPVRCKAVRLDQPGIARYESFVELRGIAHPDIYVLLIDITSVATRG